MYKIKTDLIKKYMAENNLSACDLAKKCNVSTQFVNSVLSNSEDIKLFPLLKLLRGIDIRFTEICYDAPLK